MASSIDLSRAEVLVLPEFMLDEAGPVHGIPQETDVEQARRIGREEALAECRAEVEAAQRMAHEAAAQARQDEQAKLESATAALALATREIAAKAETWIASVEDNILAIALVAARHVLGREMALSREHAREIVLEAVRTLPSVSQPLRVRLSPADYDLVAESIEHAGITNCTVVADPHVSAGCIVEAGERIVDARIDSSLNRLYERLSNA